MMKSMPSHLIKIDQTHVLDALQPTYGDIVIIDENAVLRMLLAESLTELGFNSVTFDNVKAASSHLVNVQGNCPLIIADQGVSNLSVALDFIKMAEGKWPLIPAILTSGHVIEDHLIPTSSIYLRKPYTLDQFESTVLAAVLEAANVPPDHGHL